MKFLKALRVPSKILANLIENTKGHLSEISIIHYYGVDVDNERLIKAIYQNCPNLKYLKLSLEANVDSLISEPEFKNLLLLINY